MNIKTSRHGQSSCVRTQTIEFSQTTVTAKRHPIDRTVHSGSDHIYTSDDIRAHPSTDLGGIVTSDGCNSHSKT